VDLFDKISKVTKSAVDKTTNKVELVRLNSKLNAINSGINTQKLKIGDFYWSKIAAGEPCASELDEAVGTIKNYIAQADSVKFEIQAILDSERQAQFQTQTADENYRVGQQARSSCAGVSCPSCGAFNSDGAVFCFTCGKRIDGEIPAQNCAGVSCPSCGAFNADGAVFCFTCGKRIDQSS
jgi:hypothetical protein